MNFFIPNIFMYIKLLSLKINFSWYIYIGYRLLKIPMKKEEHEDLNTMEFNLLDNVKNEVKIHKLKYIIIIIVTLLFLISLSILFFLTINHSKQINEFKKQTDDLKKENTEIFELLYNKTNETKMQLLEKESEINELKSIIDNLSNDLKL